MAWTKDEDFGTIFLHRGYRTPTVVYREETDGRWWHRNQLGKKPYIGDLKQAFHGGPIYGHWNKTLGDSRRAKERMELHEDPKV